MTPPVIFSGLTVLCAAVAVFIGTVCRGAPSAPAGRAIALIAAVIMLCFAIGTS